MNPLSRTKPTCPLAQWFTINVTGYLCQVIPKYQSTGMGYFIIRVFQSWGNLSEGKRKNFCFHSSKGCSLRFGPLDEVMKTVEPQLPDTTVFPIHTDAHISTTEVNTRYCPVSFKSSVISSPIPEHLLNKVRRKINSGQF